MTSFEQLSEDLAKATPPAFSEMALADIFTARHGDAFRFVSMWGRWFHWTGTHWQQEETLLVRDLARAICVEEAARANSAKKSLASARAAANIEALARAYRCCAATVDQWDADDWLLNTPGGVINLRLGDKQRHDPQDYITKIAGTAAGDAGTPIWDAFLMRVFDGDTELIEYMQRVVGYALTGSTDEHALFFCFGTGSNGKSVFINTVAGIFGDYHQTAPIETFTASMGDRHPTELAMLRGARLVTAIETEEGRRWAESRIKALTGGDPISARFMKQDFFTFQPKFKLLVAGNHKPGLRSVDEAIRRRFNLIPFVVTIPPHERDKELTTKLRAEWPGILSWAIRGCAQWRRQGLNPPAVVTEATASYLEGEDAIAAWIDDRCQLDRRCFQSSTDLYESWAHWCEQTGEHAGSIRRFSQALEARGFRRMRSSSARGFVGIALHQAAQQQDWRG